VDSSKDLTGLRILPAGPDDIDVLFGVYAELAADGAVEPRPGKELRQTFIEGWIQDRAVYAAQLDGVVAGGYFLRPNFPAFAAHIAQAGYLVSRSHRRRGIGRKLLEHSLQQAAADGYTAMMFNLVMESNPSRRLYESVGFEVIGSIPKVHGSEGALIYWCELAPAGLPIVAVEEHAWDREALRRLRIGDTGVVREGRPLAPVLQHVGQALLDAGGSTEEDLVRRCLAALQERDASGDDVLILELQALLGEPATSEYVPWPLPPVSVLLADLGDFLDGDPLKGDGAIDLRTGDIYSPGFMDYDRPDELDENSESYDPDRWLFFQPESGPGYRDMVDFASELPEGRLRELLFLALEGRGAFRRFRSVFNDEAYAAELTRWTLFRNERQIGRARAWLAQAGYRSHRQSDRNATGLRLVD
jgi:GNAT superfamily N-acetyltransferase